VKPSPYQMSNIYQAWEQGLPPSVVARVLRLSLHTVIAEYVRLDGPTGVVIHS